jgi:REP element-mobilizing transposase RayT
LVSGAFFEIDLNCDWGHLALMHARVPPRLTRVFASAPLYFVTACTEHRTPWLADGAVHDAFVTYARAGLDHEIGVGRYVLMPDHLHLFVRVAGERTLGSWMGGLKRAISTAAMRPAKAWQRGFFDHVLRSDESYSQKWNYVHENPVRAGLVEKAEDWPYAGEIVLIDRA